MCAIAGKTYWNTRPQPDIVRKMCDRMRHRGPDDSGLIQLDHICLGHRRLVIIDLSENARQPMVSEDSRFYIVYNGEVYNYLKLRKELQAAMVLIGLLIGLFTGNMLFFKIATILLLINMIWPAIFRPVARIWIGGSIVLGTIVSKILLTILFFGLVTPLGVIRRIAGADAMLLKQWKKGPASVFNERNHRFEVNDIEKPF